jgi:hypothetical protein
MTDYEPQVISAITALGTFNKVRYLVAEADTEIEPTKLPICIVSDGGRDFSAGRTFCGTDPTFFTQKFGIIIIADSSESVRKLSSSVIGALAGILNITDTLDTFDDELAAFVSELTFTT